MIKRIYIFAVVLVLAGLGVFFLNKIQPSGCLTGAFLADKPVIKDIDAFKAEYAKDPFFIMVFADWGKFIDHALVNDVYGRGSMLFITWEPWDAESKKPIDYDGLISGEYDEYIKSFANGLSRIQKTVFIRFAHEPNGDWYPWSAALLGKDKYIAVVKHVRNVFNHSGVKNVRWVFSINWQDRPPENKYYLCYPGDEYADYIGIDGYNWGDTRQWSRWTSFGNIFLNIYNDIIKRYNKPVLISEFGSASGGGDKCAWIKEAMSDIRRMKRIKGFVLFNTDKEADWSFTAGSGCAIELRKQLKDSYFLERPKREL